MPNSAKKTSETCAKRPQKSITQKCPFTGRLADSFLYSSRFSR
eukprot:COSAG02_NODE_432_length_22440_cov_53.821315_16_plen_43_part_00